MHQDPVTKSQRITNSSGAITSTIDLDPWGGETLRSSNQAFQPHRYTTYERDANGGDEAMMRRYAGKWHRFAQPDPYNGSYNFTNPQSFNRYAYVQNDPVNFIDPSGLDPQTDGGLGNQAALALLPRWSVDASRGPGYGGFLGDGGEVGMVIDPLGRTTRERLNPQKPTTPQQNDCLTFADMVDKIADDLYYQLDPWSGGEQAFMDRLATTFTEFRSASILAIALQRGGYSNEGFGRFHDSGFRREFRDPDPDSDNQVRHAVGGLIAGYILGATPANIRVMDRREDLNTASGQADARLNRVTMPMGNLLRNHIGFTELGGWIRDNLCAKPSQGRGIP